MLKDLEEMHSKILDAYKELLILSGVDLDNLDNVGLPTGHVPI